MKKWIRFVSFFLAMLTLCMIPLQVSADIAYDPDIDGGRTSDYREQQQRERKMLILTVAVWVVVLMLATWILLQWLKRK